MTESAEWAGRPCLCAADAPAGGQPTLGAGREGEGR